MTRQQHPADFRISEIADSIVAAVLEQHGTCPDCGGWREDLPGPASCTECGHTECGLWTLDVFWQVRSDTDYTTI